MKKNITKFAILLLIPILFSSLAFWIYYKTPLELIKTFPTSFNFESYNDFYNNGKSVVKKLNHSKLGINFEYQKNIGFQYPYVGFRIFQKNKNSYFDLSSFDEIKIKITSSKGKRIPIILEAYVPGYSDPKVTLSYRYYTQYVDIVSGKNEYIFKMSGFTTPAWWYLHQKGINESNIGKPDFSKIKCISIQGCNILATGKTDTIHLSKLEFSKKISVFIWAISLIVALYYVMLIFFFYIKKLKKENVKNVKVDYNPIIIKENNQIDTDTDKIIEYITLNYANSELSISDVQKETGVLETQISQLLKNEVDATFKQFLNQIRIAEAKRLLECSDLQVSEIAYTVGYGSVSHFNRVFKDSEEMSPVDFRKS